MRSQKELRAECLAVTKKRYEENNYKNDNYDECWESLDLMKWDITEDLEKLPTGKYSSHWSHVQELYLKKELSPMECYDCIKIGYVPSYILAKDSSYSDRI